MPADSFLDEMIHRYADGELPFEQHAALFAHLANDADARRLLEATMQFRRFSRQEAFTVTPAMDAAFLRRLAEHRRGPRRPVRRPASTPLWQKHTRVSVRTAALLALTMLLVGVWGAQQRAPEPALVRVIEAPAPPPAEEPVVLSAQYVFSPGVVVEAERR